MEKLQFIIPKVLKKKIIVLKIGAMLMAGIPSANAGVHEFGCRFGNRIFQQYDTLYVSPTNFQIDSDGNGHPNGYANLDERCDDGSNIVCTLYDRDENIVGYGNLADHSIDYCPFDDYLVPLFIFTVAVALFQMKRKNNRIHEGKYCHRSL